MSHTIHAYIYNNHDSLDSFGIGHAAKMARAMELAKEKRGLRQAEVIAARSAQLRHSPPRARRALFADQSPRRAPSHALPSLGSGLANKNVRLVGVESPMASARSFDPVKVAPPSEMSGRAANSSRATFLDVQEAAIRSARDREAHAQAGRDAQQAFANSRTPGWWPRTPKPVPRGRVASPHTVAAAEGRLTEIRTKLEAGCGLSAAEEADATAIIELKQMWKDADARAAAAAEPGPFYAEPSRSPRLAGGYEAASLLTCLV